jgi:methylenetetrahydrofolate reductase (NADPH)
MSPSRRPRQGGAAVAAPSTPADACFPDRLTAPGAFVTVVELVPWRGPASVEAGRKAYELAATLATDPSIDALSVTDNAGGHAMASPELLARDIVARGGRAIVHVACRDRNRNELLSLGWRLASEGLESILCLSGDYPVDGYGGVARPVFDLDSVGLLEMYRREGLLGGTGAPTPPHEPTDPTPAETPGPAWRLPGDGFFAGAVVNPYKRAERELVPQYQKLELKVRTGARFIIPQVGYDARKMDELLRVVRLRKLDVPVLANVFRLTRTTARLFHAGRIPGVTVTDELLALAEREGASADKGRVFFRELAARQIAIARGLGYAGAYLGGVADPEEIARIRELAATFGPDDWRGLARELRFGWPGGFDLLEPDGPLSSDRTARAYERSRTRSARRRARARVPLGYRFDRLTHAAAFTPGTPGFRAGTRFYAAVERRHLARPLHVLEQAIKIPLFDCRDCGDCSLPDIAYICPESHCVKNQRNGPCGGSREGRCEVPDRPCIWASAYDRLKPYGEEDAILRRPVVVTDHALRRTSAWANTYLGRDHTTRPVPSGGD